MTTHPLDAACEMEKIIDALIRAASYLARSDEAGAALHLADRVRYSPLTVIIENARSSAQEVRTYLHGQAEYLESAPPEPGSPNDRFRGL